MLSITDEFAFNTSRLRLRQYRPDDWVQVAQQLQEFAPKAYDVKRASESAKHACERQLLTAAQQITDITLGVFDIKDDCTLVGRFSASATGKRDNEWALEGGIRKKFQDQNFALEVFQHWPQLLHRRLDTHFQIAKPKSKSWPLREILERSGFFATHFEFDRIVYERKFAPLPKVVVSNT